MFQLQIIRLFQHILFSGQIRYLNIKREWALTPSPAMLICNELYRRTQEQEPVYTGQCLAIQRYEISQYFEIEPRKNWFISRFLWRCSRWCSTDSCGHFLYYILAIRFYLSVSVNQKSLFSNFADFRQLYIPNAQTKYNEILPVHTKTPHNTNRKIAYRYFELKYHFPTLQKIPITFEQGCTQLLSHLLPNWNASVSDYCRCCQGCTREPQRQVNHIPKKTAEEWI